MEAIGHHTCKKDGGAEYVEENAPFLSEHIEDDSEPNYTFLGTGYYYWDDNIEMAKYWGRTRRQYKKGFFIIENRLQLSGAGFLDLVGNRQHMKYFVSLMLRFKRNDFLDGNIKIGEFIEFMKQFAKHNPEAFPYTCIRAIDSDRILPDEEKYLIHFVEDKGNFINLKPRMMICVIEKKSVILPPTKIIFDSAENIRI